MSKKIKIAFDTNTIQHVSSYINNSKKISDKVKEELPALLCILENKISDWEFVLLDAVTRESADNYNEKKVSEVLEEFDERVNLTIFPMTFPVTFPSEAQLSILDKYLSIGNVSHKDALVIGDSINANCNYLITTDFLLLKNNHIVCVARKDNLTILSPNDFVKSIMMLNTTKE